MKKKVKQAVMVLGVSVILAAVAYGLEYWLSPHELTELERSTYGQGNRTENLEVLIEGEAESHEVQIEVEEQRYSAVELNAVFEKVADQLNSLILGDNQSLDHIDQRLNLVNKIPGESIEVEWELDNHEIVTITGNLRQENIDTDGNLVKLRAIMSYGEEQAVSVINIMVFPSSNKGEQLQVEIEEALERTNIQTKESERCLLPISLNGKKLVWTKPQASYSLIILLLGCAAAAYLLFIEKQNEQKLLKIKQEQMMLDYPEIVNKLVLLLGAGMTVQKAWYRIAQSYQEQKEREGIRYAYEEMLYTCHELQSKLTETESYERFGRRCNLSEYIKLGALLSQNLKKGTSGLTKMLVLEAENAFTERKSRARKKGEEAGTKLLLPMFLMLVIVLIIVIIPAFLSFQL